MRVFNPLAVSNSNMDISKCYHKHENEKKRVYEQRIRETEHSSFTPLMFSATGGMGRQATVFYQRLAAMLAEVVILVTDKLRDGGYVLGGVL